MSILTRRNFLGSMAAAGGLAALHQVMAADRSKTQPGPSNAELQAENADSMWPPGTDSKSLVQTFNIHFRLRISVFTTVAGRAK